MIYKLLEPVVTVFLVIIKEYSEEICLKWHKSIDIVHRSAKVCTT